MNIIEDRNPPIVENKFPSLEQERPASDEEFEDDDFSFDSEELNKSMTSQEYDEVNQDITNEIDGCVE